MIVLMWLLLLLFGLAGAPVVLLLGLLGWFMLAPSSTEGGAVPVTPAVEETSVRPAWPADVDWLSERLGPPPGGWSR